MLFQIRTQTAKRVLSMLVLVGLSVFGQSAYAVPISGLYNTGNGAAAGSLDTHYALDASASSAAGSVGAYGYVSNGATWPIGPWLANSETSQWITPTSNQAQTFDPSSNGLYKWSLSFDLTGYDLSSTSFTGRWAADNLGVMRLNGQQVSTASGFSTWSSFSNSSGFINGVNTIEFVVTNLAQNGGNPTGLRVEFLSSNANRVPEPSSVLLGLVGLAVMISARRARRII